ncbi:MAG: hypothetical protein ACRDRO_04455 [Pseudonocardiaceae bacterium]
MTKRSFRLWIIVTAGVVATAGRDEHFEPATPIRMAAEAGSGAA